jgi:hypothetical protein
MSKKNPTPSDDDVAKILEDLGGPKAEVEADDSEFLSMAELSPPDVAPPPVDDDRPIVVNLPERADPTKVVLAAPGDEVVKLVDPVVLGAVVVNKPAFDNNGDPIAPVEPQVAHSVTVHVPVTMVDADTADVITPSALEAAVLTAYGVTAWFNPGENYWSIRQGPRVGGVPAGASIDEWKSRCAAISITEAQPKAAGN